MVTIGADPEVFIVDSYSSDPVPICGRVGGTKEYPLDLGDGYAVQEDNVMLEYNIPPTGDHRVFADNIVEGWSRARRMVGGRAIWNQPYQGHVVNFSSHTINGKESAFRFGCSPDFNAYARGEQAPPVLPQSLYIQDQDCHRRMAGGHIHIGFDNHNNVPLWVVAMLCDYFIYSSCLNRLGCPNQGPRGQSYGSPGRFRPTAYGIEYRTPSNWWVVSTIRGNNVVARAVGAAAIKVGRMVEQIDPHVIKEFVDVVDWDSVRLHVATGGARISSETECLPHWNGITMRWEV